MSMMGSLYSETNVIKKSVSLRARAPQSVEFIIFLSHLGSWNMSQILSHQTLGWVSPPYSFIHSFIQMLIKYTLCAHSYAGPEVEGAHFLRKGLVILTGYSQTPVPRPVPGTSDTACAQPNEQDFTPWCLPHASHSTAFVVWSSGGQRGHEKAV